MRLLLCFLSISLLASCSDHNYKNDILIKPYYYKYVGFETSGNMVQLLDAVKSLHAQNDYVVTKNEALIPWEKSRPISADTLHQLHQIIHRLAPFTEKSSKNVVVIEIELLKMKKPKIPLFSFNRFELDANGEITNELNFGEHEVTLNKNTWLENAPFLAEKFAQVSFK